MSPGKKQKTKSKNVTQTKENQQKIIVESSIESEEQNKDKKSSFFSIYFDLLVKYPYLVNGILGSLITGLAVIISQTISKADHYNFGEVRAMMLINFFFITPIVLNFNWFLLKLPYTTFVRLLIDQLLFSPVFSVAVVSLRYLLLGGEVENLYPLLVKVIPDTIISGWKFWFPARYMVMLFVPPIYQYLAIKICSLLWNILLSLLLNSK